ncbi:hypothetical protein Tco_0956585 [Tanacetum coccineum]
MFTSMRCISRYEDTQVYGTILLKEQTNQAMLESKAYKTYHAFASGEKTPKPKYARKKADSDTSPKQKPVQATKGDGVDTQLKVLDKEDLKTIGADEGTGTKPGVPDLPIYKSKSEKESWGDSENEDKDDENDSDGISNEGDDDNDGNNGNDGDDDDANNDDKQEGDDTNDDDEETDNNEVTKEPYKDVNVNLGNEDTDMTDADQGDSEQQNVSQESGFDKLLNLKNPSPADNEIASLLDTTARHATEVPKITSSFTTTIPPPPLFNDRVTNLEKDMLEIKQIDQYAQALSSIPAIDEKNAYIELVDTSMRALIKEEFNTQLPQILPQAVSDFANPVVEKNVTESEEVIVLRRSSSQPMSTYEVTASLSEFELTKILIDNMEKNKSYD